MCQMMLLEPAYQDKFRVRRPTRKRIKNKQPYIDQPPLVEWGGWHLIAGGKDPESKALWTEMTELHKLPQDGSTPEIPTNV